MESFEMRNRRVTLRRQDKPHPSVSDMDDQAYLSCSQTGDLRDRWAIGGRLS
jgi:hypothetical protein